jgi:hypothetical protein
VVVNCLWEGRAVIDRRVVPDYRADADIVIRYKLCLFGTNTGLDHMWPSTRILGAFGDVASYGNDDGYLSWYPAAIQARAYDSSPPTVSLPDPARLTAATLRGLGLDRSILEHAGAAWAVHGGYIVAFGAADVDNPETLLHTRDRAAARELRPGYVSVDTGKFTLGPLMARRAAEIVDRRLRIGSRGVTTSIAT